MKYEMIHHSEREIFLLLLPAIWTVLYFFSCLISFPIDDSHNRRWISVRIDNGSQALCGEENKIWVRRMEIELEKKVIMKIMAEVEN